ncbi:nuclear transport factor 2 family protein, partial [Ruegeria sp. NA]
MTSDIVPSPELIAVVRRWNQAVHDKDRAVLVNMLSSSEHLRYQGSADEEAWSGQVFRRGFADHTKEIPDYDWQEHSLEAFECGDVGWAFCEATL